MNSFEIEGCIGKGTYGKVHRVLNKIDNQHYALKKIPLNGLEPEEIEKIKSEAQIHSKIQSPFVVRYYNSFLEENKYQKYLNIIMEYCEGGDLENLIEEKKLSDKIFDEKTIWDFFLKLTLGLAAIHKEKIIHRDIKSLNIFLKEKYEPKIGDLGISKQLTNSNFTSTAIGTPYYTPPEIIQKKPYNEKIDIWGLGCILYELCTLNHPFDAHTQEKLNEKIQNSNPEPIPKEYSTYLQNLINILLQKDPNKRPTTFEILNKEFIKEKLEYHNLMSHAASIFPQVAIKPLKMENTRKNFNNEKRCSKRAISHAQNDNKSKKILNLPSKSFRKEENKIYNCNYFVNALNTEFKEKNNNKNFKEKHKVKNFKKKKLFINQNILDVSQYSTERETLERKLSKEKEKLINLVGEEDANKVIEVIKKNEEIKSEKTKQNLEAEINALFGKYPDKSMEIIKGLANLLPDEGKKNF